MFGLQGQGFEPQSERSEIIYDETMIHYDNHVNMITVSDWLFWPLAHTPPLSDSGLEVGANYIALGTIALGAGLMSEIEHI